MAVPQEGKFDTVLLGIAQENLHSMEKGVPTVGARMERAAKRITGVMVIDDPQKEGFESLVAEAQTLDSEAAAELREYLLSVSQ